jgi:restriction endonuclease S subunit
MTQKHARDVHAANSSASSGRRVRLREICEEVRQGIQPDSEEAKRRPYLSLEHIQSESGRILGTAEDGESGKSLTFAFGPKDVLYGKLRPYLNKVALPDFEGRCTTELIPLRPKAGVDREFLAWLLRRPETVAAVMQEKTGSRMPRADMDLLLSMEISIPSHAEQKRIAERLNEQLALSERAKAAGTDKINAAIALRHALLRRAFLGIVPLAVGRKRDPAPQGWRWDFLGSLARLESGHTPSRYHPEWWGGEVPWLALPDIRELDGRLVFDTAEHTNDEGIAHSSARVLPKGTVCLSRTASVGFVTVLGRSMATSQDFVNWVCGPKLDPFFLSYLLQASREYIRSLSSGAVHKTVYVPTVKAFEVCAPDLAKQKRIVSTLDGQLSTLGSLETSALAELECITRMPNALLRAAFSGVA